MELLKIKETLEKKFSEDLKDGEKRKIIFWSDTENQFSETIDKLQLDNAKIHVLNNSNNFMTKYMLECEDNESNYLVYTNVNLHNDEDNWLIDTLLYSCEFSADWATLIIDEFGFAHGLKPIIKKYEKFFMSNERKRKFKNLESKNLSNENSTEEAMMSSLCGLKISNIEDVFKTVLGFSLENGDNKYLDNIEKNMDKEVFWNHVKDYFGYDSDNRDLMKLACFIILNSSTRTLGTEITKAYKQYLKDYNVSNCVYFVDRWMNHLREFATFEKVSNEVEKYIGLDGKLSDCDVKSIYECGEFKAVDRRIISYISELMLNGIENFDFLTSLIEARRKKHWYKDYSSIYEALYYGIKMREFEKQNNENLKIMKSSEVYKNYVENYFMMDYYYRKFYRNFDNNSGEILKKVRVRLENLYSNWYLDGVNDVWNKALKAELSGQWKVTGIENQQRFFDINIRPKLKNGDRQFVIISDGLRYEVAYELAESLNNNVPGKFDLKSMLGVLPSSTQFGMTALLPNKTMAVDEKGNVLVNGRGTRGSEERLQLLKSACDESVVIDYKKLVEMNKEERREMMKGSKVIYIYHNVIDAIGDKAASERNVFEACDKTIEEISKIISIIRGDLNGKTVFITADHGFIYKRDKIPESDKISKADINRIDDSRRYLLSFNDYEIDSVLKFKPDYLKGANDEDVFVYVPCSNIKFKVQGAGDNYVHGGASLQELVIPLVECKLVHGKSSEYMSQKKVKIKLINEVRKITNTLFTLDFFQAEKVDANNIAARYEIYLEGDKSQMLTNREIIIADKESSKPEDREFKTKLMLKSGKYERNKDYYLIIKDIDTEVIEEKIPFRINVAIESDFDF